MFARLQLATLAVCATIATVRAASLARASVDFPANCARNYTVRLGDVCDTISAALNVSTYQLTHVNSNIDANCDNLALGEPLCLGITGQDCTTTYVIQSGDNCQQIANVSSIADSTLLTNNPNVNSDCSNIYPGEVLCIASSIIPYTS